MVDIDEVVEKISKLSPRWLSILRMTTEGKRAADIATSLGTSKESISMTRSNIYKRLGLKSIERYERREITAVAYKAFARLERAADKEESAADMPHERAKPGTSIETAPTEIKNLPVAREAPLILSSAAQGIMETFFPPEAGKLGFEIEVLCSAAANFKERYRELRRAGYLLRIGSQFHSFEEPTQKSVTYLYLFR
jgi:DNA-binding CsgD family transcriptional regulator